MSGNKEDNFLFDPLEEKVTKEAKKKRYQNIKNVLKYSAVSFLVGASLCFGYRNMDNIKSFLSGSGKDVFEIKNKQLKKVRKLEQLSEKDFKKYISLHERSIDTTFFRDNDFIAKDNKLRVVVNAGHLGGRFRDGRKFNEGAVYKGLGETDLTPVAAKIICQELEKNSSFKPKLMKSHDYNTLLNYAPWILNRFKVTWGESLYPDEYDINSPYLSDFLDCIDGNTRKAKYKSVRSGIIFSLGKKESKGRTIQNSAGHIFIETHYDSMNGRRFKVYVPREYECGDYGYASFKNRQLELSKKLALYITEEAYNQGIESAKPGVIGRDDSIQMIFNPLPVSVLVEYDNIDERNSTNAVYMTKVAKAVNMALDRFAREEYDQLIRYPVSDSGLLASNHY